MIQITVYRILREAVTNVYKHAKASRLYVTLHIQNKEIYLEIRDDGIGIQSDIKENHFGMQFMREKVKLLNGSMAVDTGNTEIPREIQTRETHVALRIHLRPVALRNSVDQEYYRNHYEHEADEQQTHLGDSLVESRSGIDNALVQDGHLAGTVIYRIVGALFQCDTACLVTMTFSASSSCDIPL